MINTFLNLSAYNIYVREDFGGRMGTQEKHGRYEHFNIDNASWGCPNCNTDNLKLNEFFDNNNKIKLYYSFKCRYCGFDSKYYAIVMTKKSTFNHVHRWLKKEWKWIKYITEKFYILGLDYDK